MAAFVRTGSASALPIYASPFAKSSSGGRNTDDDDDDDSDDDDDDDSDDDDDDDLADLSDDELRAQLKSTRASLSKVNGQSMERRKKLRAKEAELEAERSKKAKPAKKKGDDDDEIDVDEITANAKREGEKAGLIRAKKSEARAALALAGVNSDRLGRAVGLIDLDDLDLDDDGLDGIDDEIEKLRKSWPELFTRPRKRRESTAGERDDGSGEKRRGGGAKTASELAAAKILGH